jgi:hypothetical protein
MAGTIENAATYALNRVTGGDYANQVHQLELPKEILDYICVNFTPGTWQIPVGGITLLCSTADPTANVEDFIIFPENKPWDIFLWFALKTTPAVTSFDVYCNVPPPQNVDLRKCNRFFMNCLSLFVMEYLLHGGMERIAHDFRLGAKICMDGLGFNPDEFEFSDLTSLTSFRGLKMPSLLIGAKGFLIRCHPAVRSRCRRGLVGNRLFTIINDFKVGMILDVTDPIIIKWLISSDVSDRAPYLSFHPDHPFNPMRECSDYIFAWIGEIIRRSNMSLPNDQKSLSTVYKSWMIEKLNANPKRMRAPLINLANFIAATGMDFSTTDLPV